MSSSLPSLPSWHTAPDDVRAAISAVKKAIRERIAAAGTSVEEEFACVESAIAKRITEIQADVAATGTAWTILDYADIAAGRVQPEQLAHLRSSGCLVVRNHFEHQQALQWDAQIVDYVGSNDFFDTYRGAGDGFFRSVDSKPEIYPIYWSPSQMEARQSSQMAAVQSFLNRMWTYEADGQQFFEPDRHAMYPDRIRRRPPGVDSGGLGAHIDAGTLDLWLTSNYQAAFHHIFSGSVRDYDPWDARHRTSGTQYAGSTVCSAFRTFQGWVALADMDHDQGVLRSLPIPEAIAYLLLRPLLVDVPDDEMCDVVLGRALPIRETWHSALMEGFSSIPDVRAGDSVWWHCDVIHGVAPVENQQGWGNVMYIPSAPWCERNERYAPSVLEAFVHGTSPVDFPAEHYEQGWPNRFQLDQLSNIGRESLGLDA